MTCSPGRTREAGRGLQTTEIKNDSSAILQSGPVGRGNAMVESSRASAYHVHRANFAVVPDRLMYDTRSPRTFITITNMVFH
jgi:hypothetical protein